MVQDFPTSSINNTSTGFLSSNNSYSPGSIFLATLNSSIPFGWPRPIRVIRVNALPTTLQIRPELPCISRARLSPDPMGCPKWLIPIPLLATATFHKLVPSEWEAFLQLLKTTSVRFTPSWEARLRSWSSIREALG